MKRDRWVKNRTGREWRVGMRKVEDDKNMGEEQKEKYRG